MRKAREITITEGSAETNRDFGKKYLLTEMDAFRAEAWARNALGALSRGGFSIDAETMAAGWSTLYGRGIEAFLAAPAELTAPLLKEMMGCVKIVTSANITRDMLADGDVEEMATIVRLRDEVIDLHVNFSPISTLWNALRDAWKVIQDASSAIQTSAQPSPEPSPKTKRRSRNSKPSTA